ncbi:hypothetical protein FRC14_000178 [Serendipita sp. 396]|nr:hypothetical protein FRC14_000178 [Serendipita sp. 396]KAG8776012.1 hypothetical protein FRC15_000192 [Serendipita sp. 397]KAG8792807.1 hypothetical protein FRC16_011265 [Serendipita sp. 398]KAG8816897.1 hypothetical protein FRC19_011721 [Serendipita sp. 401]KAG8829303.1 hypothetical protein FRC18_009400 [Serendipita sp. 400]KAG8847620.1 hypothetical protein FRB91_011589 [Serendipita sp. 411]KAG8857939.1 hypothetical protein FRC20_000177 [Serendipita sp. 405]KAG9051762.1 hypothetical prot
MLDWKKENVRRLEQEELRGNAEEARQMRKEEEQRQYKELLLKISADQEEHRRIAEERRQRAKERPRLEGVIAQLRQQNAEQRQLLVGLLDENCNTASIKATKFSRQQIQPKVGVQLYDSRKRILSQQKAENQVHNIVRSPGTRVESVTRNQESQVFGS